MIEIKDRQGNIRYSTSINSNSVYRKKLMSEDYILLRFNTLEPVKFAKGDYADMPFGRFERFELIDFNYPTYNTTSGGYEYELRLDADYRKWKNKILLYDRQGNKEAAWSLTSTPDIHLSVICSRLSDLQYMAVNEDNGGYHIDESVEKSSKLISYNNINIIDALTLIAETWNCEWWVTDNIIHLGKCQYKKDIDFELGKNVQSMSRSESNDNHATRIYAFGSARNLPPNYRGDSGIVSNGIVQKRLMLPFDGVNNKGYVDAYENMNQEEAVEAVVIFEDVYPRRTGTLSDVKEIEEYETVENENGTTEKKKWHIYRFKDADLKFKFSDKYILPEQELKIHFTEGDLNGWEFGIKFNPLDKDESDPEAQVWQIIRNEEANVPNPSLRPKNNDKYILYGFDTSFVSDTMIPDAEQELLIRAKQYVEKSKQDPSVYDCTMNVVDMVNNNIDLNIGDQVNLINPSYFQDSRKSRIYGFEKHLDGTQIRYTVGESARYSRLGEMEGKLQEIVYEGNTYTGNSGSGIYVIGKHDATRATDRNVFSASRASSEFLSKTKDDSAEGLIKFSKGTHFGNFIDSMSAGMGAGIMPEGRGQFESLEVRSYMKVMELVYNRLSAMEGDYVFTESGTTEKVHKIDNSTYLLTIRKRWENDFTAFKEGDILRGVVNNLYSKGEHYTVWMRVLNVNMTDNSIKISMYEGDLVPAGKNFPPTELMVLQRWGNTFIKERQSTWYLSSSEGRIVMLTGVTSPILQESNYGSFYGKPVHLSVFEGKHIDYNAPYLYIKGVMAQNLIEIDYAGNIIKKFRDCGEWQSNPSEAYRNTNTSQDDVWHLGAKWRCLIDMTVQEPKWNATGWQQIEGSKSLSCELFPTNGEYFYDADVDFILHWDVKYGFTNINNEIKPEDVEWTRESGDINEDNLWALNHTGTFNDLHITNKDIGYNFDTGGVTFKVRIFVRDKERVTELTQTITI